MLTQQDGKIRAEVMTQGLQVAKIRVYGEEDTGSEASTAAAMADRPDLLCQTERIMSVFGIRRKIKAGVKGSMEEGPIPLHHWQNRPPTPPAAQTASEEPAATQKDSTLTADAAPTEEAALPEPEQTPEPTAAEEVQASTDDAEESQEAAAPPAADSESASDDVVGAPLTMEAVQEILDDMVRPALQGDGGDISLLKIEDNDVYVKLVGACTTCPSSIMTMKMGVEALLREEFPSMRVDSGGRAARGLMVESQCYWVDVHQAVRAWAVSTILGPSVETGSFSLTFRHKGG